MVFLLDTWQNGFARHFLLFLLVGLSGFACSPVPEEEVRSAETEREISTVGPMETTGTVVRPDADDFSLSNTEEERLSLWQKVTRIREYKRLYDAMKSEVEAIQHQCQELVEEIASVRRSIALARLNAKDFAEMLVEHREAWRRLYAEPETIAPETPEEEVWRMPQTYLERFRPVSQPRVGPKGEDLRQIPGMTSPVPTKGDTVHLRWWHRYRVWKERYETMRGYYRHWQETQQVLEKELEMVSAELEEVKERTKNSRNLLREQQQAWRRLYEE